MYDFLNRIIRYALDSIDPVRLMGENVKLNNHTLDVKGHIIDLEKYRRIHIIGAGKAAVPMWDGLNGIMGEKIYGGIIVSLEEHRFTDSKVQFFPGSHPVPDERSLKAGAAVLTYINKHVTGEDLVFFLISGGASAMMAQPLPGIELQDKIEINRMLLAAGAEVTETNKVRKQISALKGGKLARLVSPAKVVTLVISDIVNSPIDAVGSGPSMKDNTTPSEAYAILKKYRILEKLDPRVDSFFKNLIPIEATSKKENSSEKKDDIHVTLGNIRTAVLAAEHCAHEMGIQAHILTTGDKGEVSQAAKLYASFIREMGEYHTPFKPPVLIICGGELTVDLTKAKNNSQGRGGRNQAFVLHMLDELKDVSFPYIIASIGTDGIDGSSDAAGAWIDNESYSNALLLGIDWKHYLDNFDSHHFFKEMKQQIRTGPTGTNVMDLRLFYLP